MEVVVVVVAVWVATAGPESEAVDEVEGRCSWR